MQHTENNQQNSTAHLKVAKRVDLKSFVTQKNSVTMMYGDQPHLELLWLSFHNANKYYYVAHLKLILLVSYNSVFKKEKAKKHRGLLIVVGFKQRGWDFVLI